MAKLSKALGTDLNQLAALLRSKGRKGDTILAHINPEEAALLKRRGGAGTINPDTGLMEFYDGEGGSYETEMTPAQEYVAGGGAAPELAPAVPTPEPVGVDMSQYVNLPQYQEALTGQYPAQVSGGFGTAEPFVGTPKFGAAPQFGAEGVPVTPGYAAEQAAAAGVPEEAPKKEPGALDSIEKWMKEHPGATSALGALGKFGIGALGTLPIRQQARTAQQQAQTMGQEIGGLGAQAKAQGAQMLSQAQAGQLTPAQQQQVEAARAQARQQMSRAGVTSGVAAQQAEANVQRLVQQYVSNNISDALKMINLGDTWAAKGITAGYNASQTANQAANIFYQNLLGMVGGYQPRFPGVQQ